MKSKYAKYRLTMLIIIAIAPIWFASNAYASCGCDGNATVGSVASENHYQIEPTIICDSAWSNWGDNGTCLIDSGCDSNWGWYSTTTKEALASGLMSDLYAASNQCDLSRGHKVGTVSIKLKDDGNIDLDFSLNSDCRFNPESEWHAWISNKNFCPLYGFNDWIRGTEETNEIKDVILEDGTVYIAVHAEVCCEECVSGCTYDRTRQTRSLHSGIWQKLKLASSLKRANSKFALSNSTRISIRQPLAKVLRFFAGARG
jgi:hypothetical protein